jgi:hypothetical protein
LILHTFAQMGIHIHVHCKDILFCVWRFGDIFSNLTALLYYFLFALNLMILLITVVQALKIFCLIL